MGKNYGNKISVGNKSIVNYLNKMNRNSKSVFITPCTETELLSLLNKLPNKKSSGYDGVSNILLKDIKEALKPLCKIFDLSLSMRKFPTSMKHAKVVPLYKAGLKHLSKNYRPISLLLIISKVLEKIMYCRIYTFLNES